MATTHLYFTASSVKGPSEKQRIVIGDVATIEALIGSQISCLLDDSTQAGTWRVAAARASGRCS